MEVLLVDILREKEAHRVNAITDDQSNTSIISNELPDWPLGLGLAPLAWSGNTFSQPLDATRKSNGEE